ncbi:hypothetical protein PRK78_006015 [Emydomyces testavorans]|uniref:Uncharacterized protein n=1 Tax=Emydomyces testavorans TaxID=2070801 RepID=A0AAF0DL76_9EURO|nr:hypothetical protein PRK78_006015 [Emydomyces testavorans]
MTWDDIVHEATRRPPSPPPGRVFSHTCFVYSPHAPSASYPPVIAYLPRNGDIRVEVIDLDWQKNPRIGVKELVTTKRMHESEFEDVLRLAALHFDQEDAGSGSKEGCASRHLHEFEPAFGLKSFGRQVSDIYLVTLRSGLEDDLWTPDPPSYDPTSFPTSCAIL